MRGLLPKDRVEWMMIAGALLLFGGAIVALWSFGVG